MKKFLVILHDAVGGGEAARDRLKPKLAARLSLSDEQLERIFADLPAIVADRATEKEADDLRIALEKDGALAEILENEEAEDESSVGGGSGNEIEFALESSPSAPPQQKKDDDSLLKLDLSLTDLSQELDAALGVAPEEDAGENFEGLGLDTTPTGSATGMSHPPSEELGGLQIASPSPTPVSAPVALETTAPPVQQPAPPIEPAVTKGPDAPVPPPFRAQQFDVDIPPPRRRRSFLLHPQFLMIVGIAIGSCLMLIFVLKFFLGPQRQKSLPDYRELIAALLDQQTQASNAEKGAGEKRVKKSEQLLPLWQGQDTDTQVGMKLRMLAGDTESLAFEIDLAPPPPPKLTPLQVVSGERQKPWVEHVFVEELMAPVVYKAEEPAQGDLAFEGEAIARVFISDGGTKLRVPAKLGVKGSYEREKNVLKLRWMVSNTGDFKFERNAAEVMKQADGKFVIRMSGDMTLMKNGTAPLPASAAEPEEKST